MAKNSPRPDHAALERERKREVLRQVAIGVGVVVVIAVIATVVVLRGNGSNDSSEDLSRVPAVGASAYGLGVGDKNAPHTVIVYEDFICPFCDEFERASHEPLAQAAAAGKVYVEYRPINLLETTFSAQALNAFAAVKSIAGSDAALALHNLVYANQPEEPGPSDARDQLVSWADQVVPAAKKPAVEQAIRDDTSQQAWTNGATAEATTAGVKYVPSVVLDGQQFSDGSTATELGQRLVEAVQ